MELNNKRVLVVGLGKSGVASALFLKEHGARVTVSDSKAEDQLRKEIPRCSITASPSKPAATASAPSADQDLIVVSPGVPVDAPPLVQARALGNRSSAKSNWRRNFCRADRRHHRLERQDHDHDAGGRNSGRRRIPDAGGRQYRHAGDLAGRPSDAGHHGRAGSFQLSTGDDRRFPAEDCSGSEHHAGPSRPASHLRDLCRRQGPHLREPAAPTISPC